MKLKLSAEKDIQILTVAEEIATKDFQILKAGISNLFKKGKNKIILEIASTNDIPSEVLRELAALDILARELSGRIVLAGVKPEVKLKIEGFATPPFIPCIQTMSEALQFFAAPPTTETSTPTTLAPAAGATATATPAAPGAPGTPGAPATPAEDPVVKLKEEIRQRELGEVGQLKKQLAAFQEENETLKKQLIAMVLDRRPPPTASAYDEKIKILEEQLEKAMADQAATPAGGAAAAKK